ncbi:MAG TPA: SPFH domain-containing protein [Thermomicrobiales bacterium]|nr:SPFH domain-containing protein [Thermomicrobiales bacterium]
MAIIDLIEYADERQNELVHRVPQHGSGEFKLGSQCVVRESQRAVFMRDGRALDLLPPGRHTLSTANIPMLTGLIGLPFGSKSPFRAEVYYVNTREFTDMKWGTPQPVLFRDTEFGMIRVRAFGTYSLRIKEPQQFLTQVVGTRASYTTDDIEGFLRSIVINEFNDMLGEIMTSLLDIQGLTRDIATAMQHALAEDFDRLGLELRSFQVSAVTPPEEVQKRIDERSSMGILGDMRTYTQFQTAQAIGNMGEGGSGGGSSLTEGAGLGAGLGVGMAMGEALRDSVRGGGQPAQPTVSPPAAPQPVAGARFCSNCGHAYATGARFCPNCGFNLVAAGGCPKCGFVNPSGSKFCQECGNTLAPPE